MAAIRAQTITLTAKIRTDAGAVSIGTELRPPFTATRLLAVYQRLLEQLAATVESEVERPARKLPPATHMVATCGSLSRVGAFSQCPGRNQT